MIRGILGALAEVREREQLRRRFPTLEIARDVSIRSPERLRVGEGVMIDVGAVLHCGGLGWAPEGGIVLGDRCYIGPRAVLFGGGGIEIGADTLISPGVMIVSHQHSFRQRELSIREQPLRFGRVVVGRNVWIGANAVVLPGVRLEDGVVVGAGAVVTRDIPAESVALGVPARVVGER